VSDETTLIYLEADDEITTVVRRVRETDPGRIVLVAPGRSRATSSSVALRLLARAAADDDRELAVVGDALTRSLAADAGLATYQSVDDARKAVPGQPPPAPDPAEARTAAIHVVRGPATEDTAPTLAAVVVAGKAVTREAETEPVGPVRQPGPAPARQRAARRQPRSRRLSMAAIGAALLAVVVGWGAVGAVVLPAATVTIVPHADPIGPVTETFTVADAEHLAGSVSETATVTASGSYDINAPAAGRVTFFNFNFFDVQVPAESLVATGEEEGDQAFTTLEAIVVPAGSFDPFQGGITAGEASVDVSAAAPGPAGNVEAGAIDTVLDDSLEGQLRGFPSITEALVVNPEPTSGGATEAGEEITQEDVDDAVAALSEALRAAVADDLGDLADRVHVDALGSAEPEISGLDDLVGTRNTPSAEINGTLAYDEIVADVADVEAQAIALLSADPSLIPDGWALDPESTAVEVDSAAATEEGLEVEATIRGTRVAVIDTDSILPRIVGLDPQEAAAALASTGTATIDLWPFWVGTVPERSWRVEIEVRER